MLTSVYARALLKSTSSHEVYSQQKERQLFSVVCEWFVVEPSSSTQKTACIVYANHGIQLLTEVHHWLQSRFFANGFHWYKSIHTELCYATNVSFKVYSFTMLVPSFHV